jgi:ADP-heptose:LPS heptosyltransferase
MKRLRRALKDLVRVPSTRLLLAGGGGARPHGNRILVLRPDERLGNLVLVTSLLQTLRRAEPDAEITLWAGTRFGRLLQGDPRVDRVLTFRDPSPAAALRLLRQEPWRAAILTSFPGTHSLTATLLLAASRAARRIGFDEPRTRGALTDPVAPPAGAWHAASVLPLLLAPLGHAGLPAPPPSLPTLRAAGREPRSVLLHTGGRGDKAWALEGFHRLAQLFSLGDLEVRLVPGPDAPLWPVERDDPAWMRWPLADVPTLARRLAAVELFVGCDTGVAHLAAAVGTRVAVLFRSSDPRRYAPMGPQHLVLVVGRRAAAYLREGSWPTMPASLAPALEVAPEALMEAPAREQAEWIASRVFARLLGQDQERPRSPGPGEAR